MGINQITGQPWHKERVHRAEGDERRYKGRCKYFDYDGEYCDKRLRKCYGSAHCEYYFAVSEAEFNKKRNDYRKNKKEKSSSTPKINRKLKGFSNIELQEQYKKEKRQKKLGRKNNRKEEQQKVIQSSTYNMSVKTRPSDIVQSAVVIENKAPVNGRYVSDKLVDQYLVDALVSEVKIDGAIAVVYKAYKKNYRNRQITFQD